VPCFLGTSLVNWHQAAENRKLEAIKATENKDLERQKLEGNLILTFLADKDAEARKENLLFLNRAGYIHLPADLLQDIETNRQTVPQVNAVGFGPAEGLAEPGTPLAAMNKLRNRTNLPMQEDFDTSVDLKRMLAATDEKSLDQNKAATIEGYVLKVQLGTPNSANMERRESSRKDIHIYVAPSMQSGVDEQVRCVVTPIFRAQHESSDDDWSLKTLKGTLVGRRCKISGWLIFNLNQVRYSANNPQHGAQVFRGTPWELHPVTAIEPND